MHRFYVPPESCLADTLRLTDREAHHALHVLRLREKDHVIVLNGAGLELNCEVSLSKRESLTLQVIQRKSIPPPTCAITLLQAIPKGKIIESIIQKATELGATRIVPILSERVVTHLDSNGAETKADKWQQVAIEAIKQCGSAWLPKVEAPSDIEKFRAREESFELPLIACLENDSRHLRVWFDHFIANHRSLPKSIAIWIGPEGDFTPDEYASIKATGARPITLGPLVLRVETAATFCLSALNYELQAPR